MLWNIRSQTVESDLCRHTSINESTYSLPISSMHAQYILSTKEEGQLRSVYRWEYDSS